MVFTPEPPDRRDLAFIRAEYDRLMQAQLEQQRLDWELQRLEIDLQILQDDQLLQQADLDRQIQSDLDAQRRADLDTQRAQLQQQRDELQQLREQIRAEREMLRESSQPEPEAAAQVEAEIDTADRVYSPEPYSDTQLSAWEIYCLGQLEKPAGVHTRQWEEAVGKVTGERPAPQIDIHQQWHDFRESIQATQQRETTHDDGLEL